MNTFRTIALTAAVLLAACALPGPSARAGESAAEQERKLLAVLESTAPKSEKAITCKRLVLCGSKASVPALSALLTDPELASWARIPLEAIPDPAVDEALRNSVAKYQGRLLIGVINSIGVRRDAKAIEVLSGKLKDQDPEVVAAAAAALGKIGGAQAAKILTDFMPTCPAAARADAAEALLLCADRMVTEGNNDEAVKIYDSVRKADMPKQRVLEAIRGAILARKAAGVPLLLEQLKSEDKAFFGIGLRVARELPGSEATEALVAEVSKLKPERQPLLVLALADRNDPKALPAILAAIQSGPKNVTMVGLNAMERIGNASCVPVLTKIAAEGEKDVALAAKAALQMLPAADVDADIAGRLAQSTGKSRLVLIEVMGLRRAESSAPALVSFLEDADADTRKEAAKAIASLGGAKEVPLIVKALLKTQDANEYIERALTGCAARGGAACTAHVVPLLQNSTAGIRIIALHALVCCGGAEALNAVKTALNDKDENVQDEAVRTLSTWPNRWAEDASIAEPLMTLAKTGKKPTHQILALRGYLQYLQGNKNIKDDERFTKVMEVMPQVTRPDEKRLVCSVLGTVGTSASVQQLVAFAADAAIAEEACSAIVGLAERNEMKVAKEDRQKALQAALQNSKNNQTKKKATELLKR